MWLHADLTVCCRTLAKHAIVPVLLSCAAAYVDMQLSVFYQTAAFPSIQRYMHNAFAAAVLVPKTSSSSQIQHMQSRSCRPIRTSTQRAFSGESRLNTSCPAYRHLGPISAGRCMDTAAAACILCTMLDETKHGVCPLLCNGLQLV